MHILEKLRQHMEELFFFGHMYRGEGVKHEVLNLIVIIKNQRKCRIQSQDDSA